MHNYSDYIPTQTSLNSHKNSTAQAATLPTLLSPVPEEEHLHSSTQNDTSPWELVTAPWGLVTMEVVTERQS